MLASLDGAIGPVGRGAHPGHRRGPPARRRRRSRSCASTAAARSPWTTTTRACGAPATGLRLEFDLDRAARARSTPCSRRPGRSTACCGSCSRAAAAGSRSIEPLPAPPGGRARDDRRPTRPTACSTASRRSPTPANMLAGRLAQGAGLRRGAVRHPARPRARGADVDVLLGRRRAAAARRRSRTASSTRSPAQRVIEETERARRRICTLDDVRGAEEAFIASTRARGACRSRRSTTIELPAAPGPVTRRRRERLAARIERELEAPA